MMVTFAALLVVTLCKSAHSRAEGCGIMINMKHKRDQSGFALPTVLITSIIMMIVLLSALTAASSIQSSLRQSYYERMARNAAESGAIRAEACLKDNEYVPQWGAAGSALRPGSTCAGTTTECTTDDCYLMKNSNVQTRYVVGRPTAGVGRQFVETTGIVELLRSSDGSVSHTYTYNLKSVVGATVGFDQLVFGYTTSGAFFGTVNNDGTYKTLGWNSGYHQLGNGTTINSLTPTDFILPANQRAVAGYSNFLSVGYNMFVRTESGLVYGAGNNQYGQLGNNSVGGNVPTPVTFNLPAGDNVAKSVAVGGRSTFVTTENNNIYAAGYCTRGMLGTNYPISGCTNNGNPERVALPTPDPSDPNTIPTNNISIDAGSVFLRMSGGRVYGWGGGHHGELARGNYNSSSVPVKIGTYGDAGQPKAVQVAFDGVTVFILDDNGDIKSSGWNRFGQSGTRLLELHESETSYKKCVHGSGSSVSLVDCNGSSAQQFTLENIPGVSYAPGFGRLRNAATNRCLAQDGSTTWLNLANCSTAQSQRWEFFHDRMLRKSGTSMYLRHNNDNTGVYLSTSGTKFVAANSSLVDWNRPSAMNGKIIKIHTDQSSLHVLTDAGEVWSTGLNSRGQHGDGSSSYTNAEARKFSLPAGVEAVDIYQANAGQPTSNWQNLFAIGDDGKIYGAGSNHYGQLGNRSTAATVRTPVEMYGVEGASEIQTGLGTTVVLTDRGVYTVGNNQHGQLGDGTTNSSSTPRLNTYTNVFPMVLY